MIKKSPKVLLIDDEPEVRRTVSFLLELNGIEVIEAESGQSGINLARTADPALILSDICMSGMDGFAVLDQLQKDPQTAKIPFIFMTGWSNTAKVSDHVKRGGIVIQKPFDISTLIKAVMDRLGNQEHREEL